MCWWCVSGPGVGGSVAAVLQWLCSGALSLLRCRGAAGGSGPRRPTLHPQQCPQPPALCQVHKSHSHLVSVPSSGLRAGIAQCTDNTGFISRAPKTIRSVIKKQLCPKYNTTPFWLLVSLYIKTTLPLPLTLHWYFQDQGKMTKVRQLDQKIRANL